MHLSQQLAHQFREVLLSGQWIANTNFKAQLCDLSWQQATRKIGSLNSIAMLSFHINYYINGIVNVLEGGTLDIRDKYSFDMPSIRSQQDWEALLQDMWRNAERFADLVQQLPEEKLADVFADEKYGSYYKNIIAMIEHSYYHLGQIVLIKKLLLENTQ